MNDTSILQASRQLLMSGCAQPLKTLLSRAYDTRRAALARLIRGALQNRCFLCGNMSHLEICQDCELEALDAHFDDMPRCGCCAATLVFAGVAPQLCSQCQTNPPAFDATLTCADYSVPYDSLVLALKFSAHLSVAGWFARKLAQLAHYADVQPDLIVPVPLAPARLAQRGYNQSWEITRILARLLGTSASARTVVRKRDTLPQSALADARSRRKNVREAFSVAWGDGLPWRRGIRNLAGLHVAVVDDVMTSGATLNALAQQLKQAGVARVTNLVALRTPID